MLTRVALTLPILLSAVPTIARAAEEDKASTSESVGDKAKEKTSTDKDDDKGKEKLKWEGFFRSYFHAENFKDGELFHEARLDIKTRRKRGLRGNLEVDFRTKTDDIQVNEAYLDKKFDNGLRFKGGYDQKRFGLEYEENRLERKTVERSAIYRRLDVFTYTGRESMLRLEKGSDDGLYHDWTVTLSLSEAQNATLMGNWQTEIESIDARYGVWLQGGTDKIEDGTQGVGAMMHSLWHRRSDNFWQLEWVSGVDPNQTEFEVLFDDDERVYFTGLNALGGRNFFTEEDESMMWLLGATVIYPNVDEAKYNSLGVTAGLRYDIDTLRLSLNAEWIGTNSPVDTEKRSYNESSAKLEALYAF